MANRNVADDASNPNKATIADNDAFLMRDSESNPNSLKEVLWSLIKSTFKTYYDSVTATLTNKTLTAPTIADFTNAAHDHGDADDGGAVVSSSTTVQGVIELATNAETLTGTDTSRAVTPDDLAYVGAISGWIPGTGTWSYSSADDPTFVISINADVTALIGVGDRIKLTQTTAKYFIVTAVGAYSGGATLVTVYGGTDYDLANAAITSPYYSHKKSPFGFPMAPDKWTVELSDTSSRSQASPVQNTWYNPGSLSISIPIGVWRVEAIVGVYCSQNGTGMNCFFTLSTANNSESDADFTGFVALSMPTGTYTVYGPLYKAKVLTLASKTSYYLNVRTTNASVSTIGITGDLTKTFVRAICAYL